jgi:hypothetical protein
MTQVKLSLEERVERLEKLLGVENLENININDLRSQMKLQLDPKPNCQWVEMSFLGERYKKCV